MMVYFSCNIPLSLTSTLKKSPQLDLKLLEVYVFRDVTTGATGATVVTPKFSDTLTLSQPKGQILPTIAVAAANFVPWLRP